ncbi:hypothetical protein BGW38_005354 [Lunasporangiospora selenospora]|uniref:ABC-type branched-chain amino acid transport system, substrate-binding protein n=1 Tax=Lunasporangiospora selenospora TaxID=979761 RepID=A0A9P6G3E9_9FUNG|nr:hypothetical protein BGW38_005354 [Lunasporangiospora selenospora]
MTRIIGTIIRILSVLALVFVLARDGDTVSASFVQSNVNNFDHDPCHRLQRTDENLAAKTSRSSDSREYNPDGCLQQRYAPTIQSSASQTNIKVLTTVLTPSAGPTTCSCLTPNPTTTMDPNNRPSVKPNLLTDYEFNHLWDPDPNTLRLGVLMPFDDNPEERESKLARKGLSVIRMAVNEINENKIIPGINMSVMIRDSQEPVNFSTKGGAAAITATGKLLGAKASREYFADAAKKLGIFILAQTPLSTSGVPLDPNYGFVKSTIDSSESRVQVLLATGQIQLDVLKAMKLGGYMEPDYAWVTLNDISAQLRDSEDHEGYDGLVMIDNGWILDGYAPYETFKKKWMSLNTTDWIPNPSERTPANPIIQDIISGLRTKDVRVSQLYDDVPYESPAGPITLDSNGDVEEGDLCLGFSSLYDAYCFQGGLPIRFATVLSNNYTQLTPTPFKKGYPLPDDAPPWAAQRSVYVN